MREKKAIVLPETLRIIIGVLCIILLFYLAVNLYGIFTTKADLEKATVSLNKIIEIASGEIKDSETKAYIIVNPKNWMLFYDLNAKKLCIGQTRIIEGGNAFSVPDETKQRVCKEINNINLIPNTGISIKPPMSVYITKNNGNIVIGLNQVEVLDYFKKAESSESVFSSLLNFKLDGSEISFESLINNYISEYEAGTINNDKTNIKNAFDEFMKANNLNGVFSIYNEDKTVSLIDVSYFPFLSSSNLQGAIPQTKKINSNGKVYEIFFNFVKDE